jgi:hypothetical protein
MNGSKVRQISQIHHKCLSCEVTRYRTVFTLAVLLSVSRIGICATDSPTPSPSLLTALAQADSESHPTLIIDGDKIAPLKKSAPASPGDTTRHIANAYGMTADLFGGVYAIGPTSMFRYNEDPKDPNVFENMDRETILPLLAGNISRDQWLLLTGSAGLGLGDLTTDTQRALFTALLPKGKARVAPGYFMSDNPPGTVGITDRLPQVKLHLELKANVTAALNGREYGFADDQGPIRVYQFLPEADDENFQETLFGIPVRQRLPNALKKGDLNWSLAPLETPVSLEGVKTIGDLVTKIGWTTSLEIYADRTLEKKSVAVLGANRAIPASDLLRALAFALSGTYRKVGAAYVLTDNLLGRTVLWRRWCDIEALVSRKRDELKETLAKSSSETRSADDLSVAKSGDDLTADQLQSLLHPKQGYPGGMTVMYKDISPTQKRAILHNRDLIRKSDPLIPAPPPGDGDPVEIHIAPSAYLTAPGLDGQIYVSNVLFLSSFFRISLARSPSDAPAATETYTAPVKPEPPKPSLAAALACVSRRAVMAQPKTPSEVDDLLASMHAIGLNELWLDVFSQGESHLSPASDPNASDILTEALRAAPKAGVRIVPTLDLYLWGSNPPEGFRDRNLHGDDSRDADARQIRIYNDRTDEADDGMPVAPPFSNRLYVEPANTGVQSTLMDLVTRLASLPGVAGMVWRTTDPPGYRVRDTQNTPEIPDLGYTEDLRLGFLRNAHTDPVDIWPNAFVAIDGFLRKGIDVPMSEFQDSPWRAFRNGAKRNALAQLLQSARKASGSKTISVLLQQDGYNGGGTGWYGSWDDPRQPLPVYHSDAYLAGSTENYARQGNRLAQAKVQSKTILYLIRPGNATLAEELAAEIVSEVKGKGWNGFVIDARRDSIEQRDQLAPPANPLAELAESASRQAVSSRNNKQP